MSEVTVGRRGRPRDASVNEAVLRAAARVLSTNGYAGFSMERVAAEAGVGKQSLYRRWSSKGSLLIDLYMDRATELPIVDGPVAPPREKLSLFMQHTVDRLRDPVWLEVLRSIVAETQSDGKLRDEVLNKIIQPRRRAFKEIISSCSASEFDREILCNQFFGSIWYRVIFYGSTDFDSLINDLIESVMTDHRMLQKTYKKGPLI